MDLGMAGLNALVNRGLRSRQERVSEVDPNFIRGKTPDEWRQFYRQKFGPNLTDDDIEQLLSGEPVRNPMGDGYILPPQQYMEFDPRGGFQGTLTVPLDGGLPELTQPGYQAGPSFGPPGPFDVPSMPGQQTPDYGGPAGMAFDYESMAAGMPGSYDPYDPKKGKGPPPWMSGGTSAPSPTPPVADPTQTDGGGGGNIFSSIGGFIKENPELVTGLASTAVDIYGSVQEGKARDRELDLLEERERARQEEARQQRELDEKRRRDEQIYALLGAMSRGI